MKRLLLVLLSFVVICEVNSQVFQPGVFQPQTTDYSILQRSLEEKEKRKNNANQEYIKLCQLLAEKHQLLHNDQETLQWFENLKKETLGRVQSLLNIGDYDLALEKAIRLQGEIAYNPELSAKIRANAEYEEICNRIMSRTDMTQSEKNEWIKSHPYKFSPFIDKDGVIFGGKLDIDY